MSKKKSKEAGKEIAVRFSIANIYVSEFFLDENYLQPLNPLGITVSHKINIDEHGETRVKIKAVFLEQEKDREICFIICTSVFNIEDALQYKTGNKFNLPETFFLTIASISYTHTRAILSQHANGVFLLPMINPEEFFGASIRKSMISSSTPSSKN